MLKKKKIYFASLALVICSSLLAASGCSKKNDEPLLKDVPATTQINTAETAPSTNTPQSQADKTSDTPVSNTTVSQDTKKDAAPVKVNENNAAPTNKTTTNNTAAPKPATTFVYGNSSGNLMNHGLVAYNDGYVYYDLNGLKRAKSGASDYTQLSSDNAGHIQVIGDWVYYNSFLDGIYKVKKDGSSKKLIVKVNTMHMQVVNDWVYYLDNSQGDLGHELWKVKTDGSSKTRIPMPTNPAVGSSDDYVFYVSGDWIYLNVYLKNVSPIKRQFYRIKSDGSAANAILDSDVMRYSVVGEWVYYYDYSKKAFFKIKPNGTGKTLVYSPGFHIYEFIVNGNSLYFSVDNETGNGTNEGLYKVGLDGTGVTRLSETPIKYFNIAADWAYYGISDQVVLVNANLGQKPEHKYYLIRVKLDGSIEEIVNR
jgi:hypothetical protein